MDNLKITDIILTVLAALIVAARAVIKAIGLIGKLNNLDATA